MSLGWGSTWGAVERGHQRGWDWMSFGCPSGCQRSSQPLAAAQPLLRVRQSGASPSTAVRWPRHTRASGRAGTLRFHFSRNSGASTAGLGHKMLPTQMAFSSWKCDLEMCHWPFHRGPCAGCHGRLAGTGGSGPLEGNLDAHLRGRDTRRDLEHVDRGSLVHQLCERAGLFAHSPGIPRPCPPNICIHCCCHPVPSL